MLNSVLNYSMSFLPFAIVPDTMLNLLFKSKFSTPVFPIFILKKKEINKKYFYIKLGVCVTVNNLLLILFNFSLYVSIFLLKFLERSVRADK